MSNWSTYGFIHSKKKSICIMCNTLNLRLLDKISAVDYTQKRQWSENNGLWLTPNWRTTTKITLGVVSER